MTFEEVKQFVYSINNLPRQEYMKDPRHCGVYLDRLQFLLDILGNPEKQIPHYIHVTGTSGKGSVCNFLHYILKEAGKKVGSTTSPHGAEITERWRINDKYMSQKEFVSLVMKIKPALEKYVRTSPYDMVSDSELMTAMGFLYFAEKKADWAILEVGCGGRYDATNVIPRKDVAVITNIGLDHTNLWPTKKDIVKEKSGIIKTGCEVFTTERDKEMLKVIKKECKKTKTSLRILNPEYSPARRQAGILNKNFSKQKFISNGQEYEINVPGIHQIKNALLANEVSKHIGIEEAIIKRGLRVAKQPYRMEVIQNNPTIILDSAHNIDKIKTTFSATGDMLRENKKADLHLLIGFSNDKNIKQLIKQLAKLEPASIACTRNTVNMFRKAAYPGSIAGEFKKLLPKAKIEVFLEPEEALSWSRKQTKKHDILLITGSIFVSGQIRPSLTKK